VTLGVSGAAIVVAAALYARFDGLADRPPLTGAMEDFVVRSPPAPVPAIAFVDGDGKPHTLADFRGRIVLLNLWATWCAPCVEEMPSLARLQATLAGQSFMVLAVSQDRGGLPLVEQFFREHALSGLEMFADKTSSGAHGFKLRGLPTSVLLDAEGRELGRLEGAADWSSPEALALVRFYLRKPNPPTTTAAQLDTPVPAAR